ncbi:MAG: response regulator [Eubacteriales bacterium]|nr:response regulator [Eubacteriales bacterium]
MGYRIIISDDEKNVLRLIERLGHWKELDIEIVDCCQDGKTALESILRNKPDLVVSDIKMPVYDGIALIEKVKEQGLDTLFILVSGYRHFEYARNAIQLGVMDYLLKPIDEQQLNETLYKVCRKIDNLRENREKVQAYDIQTKQDMMKQFWEVLIRADEIEGAEYLKTEQDCNRVYGTEFNKPCYQVLSMATSLNAMLEHQNSLFSDKVRSFVNVCFAGSATVYYHTTYRGHIIILNFEKDRNADIKDAISVFFCNVRDLRNIYGDFRLNIGCSEVHYDIGTLRDAFIEANAAEWGRLVFLGNSIVEYRQVRYLSGFAQEELISEEEMKQLQECIKFIKQEEASRLFEKIYKRAAALNNANPQDMRRQYWIITWKLLELFEGLPEYTSMEERFYYAYLEAKNFQDIFKNIYLQIENYILSENEKLEEQHGKVLKIAVSYMKEHYMQAISQEDVAQAANVSSGYLSKLFKKELDIGFSEYLTQIRLDEAMHLLAETNLSIKDITQKVGYPNEKYFFKLFKKNTGIRPTDYRKLYG